MLRVLRAVIRPGRGGAPGWKLEVLPSSKFGERSLRRGAVRERRLDDDVVATIG